ncbi:regulator [Vibrio cionasavignyae]|uniref:regulator n=1 Tax=Vibrio cionasavignyae TaxID=2910252 RepID=UPI003D0CF20E
MRFTYNKLSTYQKHKTLRIFEDLTVESVAKICFKSVTTVEKWKSSGCIPPEYKRLVRLYRKRELSDEEKWDGFYMVGDSLCLPTGQLVQPQQIILAMALLELGAHPDVKINSKIARIARKLNELRLKP